MKKVYLLALILISGQWLSAQAPPNIVSTDVHGNAVDMYAMRDAGNTVLLDFFFADCPPCNDMMPFLVDIYAEFGNGNLDLRAISVTDRDADFKVIAFEELYGASWHAIDQTDGNSIIYNDYATQYAFVGFPTISVLCPDNTFTWDIWGTDYNAIADDIRQAISSCGASLATGTESLSLGSSAELSPNPAVDFANLTFDLTVACQLNIGLFNVLGEKVLDLGTENYSAGSNRAQLEVQNLPAGVYILKMTNAEGLSDEIQLQIVR